MDNIINQKDIFKSIDPFYKKSYQIKEEIHNELINKFSLLIKNKDLEFLKFVSILLNEKLKYM